MATIDLSAPDNRYYSGYRDVDGKVHGPRLVDTEVAFATYGVPIPQLCGINRLSGNTIWAKPLKENSTTIRGIIRTTYTGSWAVAFGRPVSLDAIGTDLIRVWLNGRLVFDARPTSRGIINGFNHTWYEGSETQVADGTIIAEEGIANVPAFRGIMYLVIADLDLATFEDRIPHVSVEIGDIASITDTVTQVVTASDGNNAGGAMMDWPNERVYMLNNTGANNYIKVYDISGDSASLISEIEANTSPPDGLPSGIQASVFGHCYVPWIGLLFAHTDPILRITDTVSGYNPLTAEIEFPNAGTFSQSFQMVPTRCNTIAGEYTYILNRSALFGLEILQISPDASSGVVTNATMTAKTGVTEAICPGPRDQTECSFFVAEGDSLHKVVIKPALIANGLDSGFDITEDYIPYAGVETTIIRGVQYDVINNCVYIFYDEEARKVSLDTLADIWNVNDPAAGFPDTAMLWQSEIQTGKLVYVKSDGDFIEWDLARGTYNNYAGSSAIISDGSSIVSGVREYGIGFGVSSGTFAKSYYRDTTQDTLNLGDIIRYYGVQAGYLDADITIDASVTENVVGFLIDESQTFNDIIEPMRALFGLEILESGDKLVVYSKATSYTTPDFTITEDELIPDGPGGNTFKVRREEEGLMPNRVSFTYIDSSLNYEWATQNVSRPRNSTAQVNNSDNSKDWKLPVVMESSQAKYAAYRALMNPFQARKSYFFKLGKEYMNVEPGDVISITFNSIAHLVQVVSTTISKRGFEIEIEGQDFQEYEDFTTVAFPGNAYDRVITNTDLFKGVPMFFETPLPIYENDDQNSLSDSPTPWLYYFVVPKAITTDFNVNARAQYSIGYDNRTGADPNYSAADGLFDIAVPWGSLTTILKTPRSLSGLDRKNTITFKPKGGDVSLLSNATTDQMLSGSNRAVIMTWDSCEVIGYETVTTNLDGTIVLSGLQRGLAGTDFFVAGGTRSLGNNTTAPSTFNFNLDSAATRGSNRSYIQAADSRVRTRLGPDEDLWPAGSTITFLSPNWVKLLRIPYEQGYRQEINFRVPTDFVSTADAQVYSRPMFCWSTVAGRAKQIRAERNSDGDITVKWTRTYRPGYEWPTNGDGDAEFEDKFYKNHWLILMYRKDSVGQALIKFYTPFANIDVNEYTFTQAEILAAAINTQTRTPYQYTGSPLVNGNPPVYGTPQLTYIDGDMNDTVEGYSEGANGSGANGTFFGPLTTVAPPQNFGILSGMVNGDDKNFAAFSEVDIVIRQITDIGDLIGADTLMETTNQSFVTDTYGQSLGRLTIDNELLVYNSGFVPDNITEIDLTRDVDYKVRYGPAIRESVKIKDV